MRLALRARSLAITLLLLSAACTSGQPSQDAIDAPIGTSLYALVETIDGTAFAPPLGPDVVPAGTFDATLEARLQVVLESTDGAGQVATVATFGAGTQPALRLYATHEVYFANVPAAPYFTDATRAYRFRALLDGREIGRSDLSSRVFEVMRTVPNLLVGVKLRVEARAVPSISSLSPARVDAESPALTLTVHGAGFVHDSAVHFGSTVLATTWVSASELTALVPAAELAGFRSVAVSVSTPAPGGGASGSATFTVEDATPVLSAISPSAALRGSGPIALTLDGARFVPTSVVYFGARALAVTAQTANRLVATLPADALLDAGAVAVQVSTLAGSRSAAASFVVSSPVPSISALSPAAIVATTGAFTLTIDGAGFLAGAVAHFAGASVPTTLVSDTRVVATVPAGSARSVGSYAVTVSNAAPTDGESGALLLRVASAPELLSIVTCPEGYVYVPADATLGTRAFCLAKYEMRAVTVGGVATAVSQAAGVPWTNVDRTTASAACAANGRGRLPTNLEWQALARNLENVPANWSGGAVGSGVLAQGHTDGSPAGVLGAATDLDGWSGTNDDASTAWAQRRTHTLSTGAIVWDVAGNAREWVSDDVRGTSYALADQSAHALPTTNNARRDFGPLGSYTAAQNLGWVAFGTGGTGARRGGYFGDSRGGLFDADMNPIVAYPSSVTPYLLLHGDGADGSAVFTNSGARTYTINTTGAPRITTAQSRFGGASMTFNGASEIYLPSSQDWNCTASDCTLDFWIRATAYGHPYVGQSDGGNSGDWMVYSYGDGRTCIGINGVNESCTGAAAFPLNTWAHLAFVKSGGTTSIYVNGTRVVASTLMTWTNSNKPLRIAREAGTWYFSGQLDEVRFTKGYAAWTTSFAVPTVPFGTAANDPTVGFRCVSVIPDLLLHGDGLDGGTSFVNSGLGSYTVTRVGAPVTSTAQSRFGGASLQFAGSRSELDLSASTDWDCTTGDCTVDFWLRPTSYSIYLGQSDGPNSGDWMVYTYGDGRLCIGINGVNEICSAPGVITLDTWRHLAFVKSAGITTIYVNGAAVASGGTLTWTRSSAKPLRIGGMPLTGGGGWIDELRFVKGWAAWTANFTPPATAY